MILFSFYLLPSNSRIVLKKQLPWLGQVCHSRAFRREEKLNGTVVFSWSNLCCGFPGFVSSHIPEPLLWDIITPLCSALSCVQTLAVCYHSLDRHCTPCPSCWCNEIPKPKETRICTGSKLIAHGGGDIAVEARGGHMAWTDRKLRTSNTGAQLCFLCFSFKSFKNYIYLLTYFFPGM